MACDILLRSYFLASALYSPGVFYALSFPCGLEMSMAYGNLITSDDV